MVEEVFDGVVDTTEEATDSTDGTVDSTDEATDSTDGTVDSTEEATDSTDGVDSTDEVSTEEAGVEDAAGVQAANMVTIIMSARRTTSNFLFMRVVLLSKCEAYRLCVRIIITHFED